MKGIIGAVKRLANILLAAALACTWPMAALADDEGAESGSTTAVAEEAGEFTILAGDTDIEKLTDAYEAARADVEAVDAQIAEIQVEVDALEAELPAQQERSDAAMKQRYIIQTNPLLIVESLLSSNTLGDFIKRTDYIEFISKSNLAELNRMRDLQAKLDEARAEQERLKVDADARAAEAEEALREVQDERAEAQSEAQSFAIRQAAVQGGPNSIEKDDDGDDSKKSEKERKAEAEAKAKKAKEDAAKGIWPAVEATMDTEGLEDGADWHADRDAFIDEWAERIDVYLEGSALEGQGRNFASAAWKYGIDPRWSPAISNTESSKGAVCIRPHNAWGWGAADSDPYGLALEWGSWEEAIDAHVKGLAKGYGYTVSMSKARTYCPPNWQRWYNNVLHDMASM